MNNWIEFLNNPQVLLLALLGFALLLIIVFTALMVFAPGLAQRQFIKDVLANPAIQEKLRGQDVDVVSLITTICQQNQVRERTIGLTGLLAKINQDITWDISGVIGFIVTVVLMVLIVTQKSENIPKEVFAGWTMILGFYFGKATKR